MAFVFGLPRFQCKLQVTMKWRWMIGRIAGIELHVHATFLIFVGWLAFRDYIEKRDPAAVIAGLTFTFTLFGIIILHELGHAMAARRYGIGTRDITLWPIGGVARLERMPEDPRQELVVALAGPAVNVVIALILAVILGQGDGLKPGTEPGAVPYLVKLFWVNVMLAAFNLVPAFPMDGGRVLRALLAMRLHYARATRIAANVGQSVALLFGLIGMFGNPVLLFIALFVWMGAAQESQQVEIRSALSGVTIRQVMVRELQFLGPQETLASAVQHLLDGFQCDFPVVDGTGTVIGILTRDGLLNALATHGQAGSAMTVDAFMEREFSTTTPGEDAENAFTRLQENHSRSLPVLENGHLVGLVTPDNLGEFLMIQKALHG